jgi:hypothetical protein
MQSVSGAFTTAAAAAINQPSFEFMVSWLKTYTSGAIFFTIGTSAIAGTAIISGGGTPTIFDKYNYVLETDNVNSITIDRIISSIPIGIMSAQLDAVLDNTSKRYLPNFDGTIGAYIKPGRPIKVSIGFDSERVQQFVGYTGRPSLTLGNRSFKVHAFDAMEYLNNFESELDMQIDISVTDMIALLLLEAGFNSSQYVLESSVQNPIRFIEPKGKKAGKLIKDLVEAELGVAFFDEVGTFRFWNRLHISTSRAASGVLNYSNMNDLAYVDTPVINHIRVNARPRGLRDYQPVWLISESLLVPANSTITQLGTFSDEDGEMPVDNAMAPSEETAPINDSYYTTNYAADGTDADAGTSVSSSNFYSFGNSFTVDFTNSSINDVYITRLAIYGNPAKIISTIVQEYKDDASITENGLNPDDNGEVIEITNDYIQDEGNAYAYAFQIVNQYAQPRRQFIAPIFPNPAYQFGDRLDVTIADTTETLTCIMLGSRISMSQDTVICQQVTLEARTLFTFFTIGTSAIAGPDVIAG